ncbi:hypothetical protein SAMN05216421_1096 [Halopseudomonas xinjiangensis]|uniref:Uncharacterized protein n=1 Tax=Halopseudomonas xinjiangensis TaxID=487184 RepID=A0A1H1QAQ2_9GAMM|nr:hypothetical protein [Halopseudomonas xinjiangensis]SDS20598.1 hypothetical protein SAMN05216421_1096 [Halopseudomonas xinjiangensis]
MSASNKRIQWERVEPGLDVWEAAGGYRRERYRLREREIFIVTCQRDGGYFFSHDPDDLDKCVRIHMEEHQ